MERGGSATAAEKVRDCWVRRRREVVKAVRRDMVLRLGALNSLERCNGTSVLQ